MIWKIKRFFEKLNKVIRFIPVIWRSSEWDYTSLLEIMRHQLKELRTCLENGHLKSNPIHAKKVRTCELLINRLLRSEFDYYEYEMNQHDLKWGKANISWKETDNSHLVEMVLTRDNIKSPKDEKLESEEFRRIVNHRNYMEKQDIEYLFYIMKKNLTCWWD